MNNITKEILSTLIKKHENHYFKGQWPCPLSLKITPQKQKNYFNEKNFTLREEANNELLSFQSWLTLYWEPNRELEFLKEIVVTPDSINLLYKALRRTPTYVLQADLNQKLEEIKVDPIVQKADTVIKFITFIQEACLKHNRSISPWGDLTNPQELLNLIRSAALVETNPYDLSLREFSKKNFQTTKTFEQQYLNQTCKLLKEFTSRFNGISDNIEILSEFGIYKNPEHLIIKGNYTLYIDKKPLDLSIFPDGIGFPINPKNNLPSIFVKPNGSFPFRIMTIENETTFYQFQEGEFLTIYLQGFHSRGKRKFLQNLLAEVLPEKILHFGDIDAGGIYILQHLRKKLNLPENVEITPYKMSPEILLKNKNYASPLTKEDIQRLHSLKASLKDPNLLALVKTMLENNIKLEQEELYLNREISY